MDPPDGCPTGIYDIMCSCWEMEPNDRPTFLSLQQMLSQSFGELCSSGVLQYFLHQPHTQATYSEGKVAWVRGYFCTSTKCSFLNSVSWLVLFPDPTLSYYSSPPSLPSFSGPSLLPSFPPLFPSPLSLPYFPLLHSPPPSPLS